jgi:hypothetical protein
MVGSEKGVCALGPDKVSHQLSITSCYHNVGGLIAGQGHHAACCVDVIPIPAGSAGITKQQTAFPLAINLRLTAIDRHGPNLSGFWKLPTAVDRHRTPWTATQLWWDRGGPSECRNGKILSNGTAQDEERRVQDPTFMRLHLLCVHRPFDLTNRQWSPTWFHILCNVLITTRLL